MSWEIRDIHDIPHVVVRPDSDMMVFLRDMARLLTLRLLIAPTDQTSRSVGLSNKDMIDLAGNLEANSMVYRLLDLGLISRHIWSTEQSNGKIYSFRFQVTDLGVNVVHDIRLGCDEIIFPLRPKEDFIIL